MSGLSLITLTISDGQVLTILNNSDTAVNEWTEAYVTFTAVNNYVILDITNENQTLA